MSSVAPPEEGSVSGFVQPIDSNLVLQTFPQPAQIACLNKYVEANSFMCKKLQNVTTTAESIESCCTSFGGFVHWIVDGLRLLRH